MNSATRGYKTRIKKYTGYKHGLLTFVNKHKFSYRLVF